MLEQREEKPKREMNNGQRATCCVRLLPDQDPFVLSPALLTFEIAYQEHKSAVKLTKANNRTHDKQS